MIYKVAMNMKYEGKYYPRGTYLDIDKLDKDLQIKLRCHILRKLDEHDAMKIAVTAIRLGIDPPKAVKVDVPDYSDKVIKKKGGKK